MSAASKGISDINERIGSGRATVLTGAEMSQALRDGRNFVPADLDVVTMNYSSAMSGSAIMTLVPVADRGVFTRASRIWLNGVPGFPGPAPNERLGMVDVMIFADHASRDRGASYTGADLIVDMLRQKSIDVECLSVEGDTYYSSFRLSDLQFARMYVYNAFLTDPQPAAESSALDADTAGCIDDLRIGDKVLLNHAVGIVVGSGTRNCNARKSLSIAADMFEMVPDSISVRESGEERKWSNSIGLAVPVRDEQGLGAVLECLGRRGTADRQAEDLGAARLLKNMILNRDFLLADSDMRIEF